MKKYAVLMLSLVVASLCFAQPAQRSIQVVGKATVSAVPAEFMFTIPMELKGMDYDQCYKDLVSKVNAVTADLKKAGYDDKAVTIENLSVREQYNWDQNQKVFQGYVASVTMSIRGAYGSTQLNKVLKVMRLHECLYVVRFELSQAQRDALRKEAIELAVSDALSNAVQLAKSSGVTLGNIIRIDYTDGVPSVDEFMPRALSASKDYSGSAGDIDLSPQRVSVEKYVNIVYHIE